MKKAIGYIRVSTEEQARDGLSLEAQTAKLAAYGAVADLDLVSVQTDAGISGKSAANRPGLQAALKALAAGEADALVVVKLDRLSRSTIDTLDLVDRSRREGWALHSMGEKLDTDSACGRLVVTMFAALAQMERERIGENTKAALKVKSDRGDDLGRAPLGKEWDGNGHLVTNESEAAIVQRIVDLKADGLSNRKIAAWLTRDGAKTKRGGTWTHVQVGGVLRRQAS